MKNLFSILAVCALAVAAFAPTTVMAQSNTDNHTVTISVSAINILEVGPNVTMTINAAAVGSEPTSVTAPSSWSLTTNLSSMKVTAALSAAYPAGLTLEASLAAPSVGSSSGYVTLGTGASDMVTGISQVAGQSLGLTYRATATVAAGVLANQVRTVTYTLTSM